MKFGNAFSAQVRPRLPRGATRSLRTKSPFRSLASRVGSGRGRSEWCAAAQLISHVGIVRSTSSFGRRPVDIPCWIFDVASLAVNAVLRVDHETGPDAPRSVGVNNLVNSRGTIKPRG